MSLVFYLCFRNRTTDAGNIFKITPILMNVLKKFANAKKKMKTLEEWLCQTVQS